MDETQIRKQIRELASNKSLTDVARDLKVSVQYLHDVVNRRRKPGKKLLKGLGLERRVEYVERAR